MYQTRREIAQGDFGKQHGLQFARAHPLCARQYSVCATLAKFFAKLSILSSKSRGTINSIEVCCGCHIGLIL